MALGMSTEMRSTSSELGLLEKYYLVRESERKYIGADGISFTEDPWRAARFETRKGARELRRNFRTGKRPMYLEVVRVKDGQFVRVR